MQRKLKNCNIFCSLGRSKWIEVDHGIIFGLIMFVIDRSIDPNQGNLSNPTPTPIILPTTLATSLKGVCL